MLQSIMRVNILQWRYTNAAKDFLSNITTWWSSWCTGWGGSQYNQERMTGFLKILIKKTKKSCDQCDYKATQRCRVKIHNKSTHQWLKHKHICEICGYKASRLINLSAHIHVSIRSFSLTNMAWALNLNKD